MIQKIAIFLTATLGAVCFVAFFLLRFDWTPDNSAATKAESKEAAKEAAKEGATEAAKEAAKEGAKEGATEGVELAQMGATPKSNRAEFDIAQVDTSALGIVSLGESGLLAGNERGELRIFSPDEPSKPPVVFSVSETPITASILDRKGVYYLGDERGTFKAIDSSGKEKWSFKTANQITGGARFFDGRIYFGSYDGSLYALAAETGELVFQVECDAAINGSPVFSESLGVFFFGSCDGVLRKVSASDGRLLASFDMESPIPSSPVLRDGILYALSHEGELIALDADSFKPIYREKTPNHYVSSPLVTDEFLFLTNSEGVVHVHDRSDGKRVATLAVEGKMTPIQSERAGGYYAVTEDGKLFVFQKEGEIWTRKELADFQTDVRQSAFLAGRIIFVADRSGNLYEKKIGGKSLTAEDGR